MKDIRNETASRLKERGPSVSKIKAFVGLDGFVDEIFHIVDKRESATSYSRVPTIAKYAERLGQAAGKSTNIELVSQMVKLGGNGPIMANALASLGVQVTYLGNLGYPNLHPVFEEFSQRATVHSIADPGFTDALEFEDGKLLVGKHQSLKDVNWANIIARFGKHKLEHSLEAAQLICFVNWTMLTSMSEIWEAVQREITPGINGERRLFFVDLADPEKRTVEDLQHGLNLVGKFQKDFDVILGLNEKESGEVGRSLGLDTRDTSVNGLSTLASQIREQLEIDTVVIHPVDFAVAADATGTSSADGPFTSKPRITTGAGDHFNAGFCFGRLLGLSNLNSLYVGVTTSGHYVRTAKSPTVQDLTDVLVEWPQMETRSLR